MTNLVLDAINTRRSVRAYTDEKLTDKQISALTTAAIAAPSARNIQPWKFIVVKNAELIAQMEEDFLGYFKESGDDAMLQRFGDRKKNLFYGAPVVVFVAVGTDGMPLVDAGIAVENLAIAAKSMGLDSVIVAMARFLFMGSKADYWKETLQFPEGYSFGISIAVGHAEGEGKPHNVDPSKICIID